MAIETLPIKGLWSVLSKLPGFMLRWYFKPEKLGQLVYVDVRPRHDSTVVDLGPGASFTIYLQAINLSPFSIELDRANFRLWCGGATLNASILKRQVIAPGEITSLYVHEVIPDGHANQIAKSNICDYVALDGNIEFNCKVRSFAKTVGHLDGINPKILNANARTNS